MCVVWGGSGGQRGDRCGLCCACVESGVSSLDNLSCGRRLSGLLRGLADYPRPKQTPALSVGPLQSANPTNRPINNTAHLHQPATCWYAKRLPGRGHLIPRPVRGCWDVRIQPPPTFDLPPSRKDEKLSTPRVEN